VYSKRWTEIEGKGSCGESGTALGTEYTKLYGAIDIAPYGSGRRFGPVCVSTVH